jgi:hypothetical protein
MSKVPAFHRDRPGEKYHDNNHCGPGSEIPLKERKAGTGGYPHCTECERLNREGK